MNEISIVFQTFVRDWDYRWRTAKTFEEGIDFALLANAAASVADAARGNAEGFHRHAPLALALLQRH